MSQGDRSCPSSPTMYRFRLRNGLQFLAFVSITILVTSRNWCDIDSDETTIRAPQNPAPDSRPDPLLPLIFIGGIPRSGTTLMRAMLDAHPDVRCGEETRIVPRLLDMLHNIKRSPRELTRLREAGLTKTILRSATASAILDIIVNHGEPAPRLCNKDPFTMNSAVELSLMFPNSKLLLMVRDGRAVVNSIITHQVSITGFNHTSFRNCLETWSKVMDHMYGQCVKVGRSRCMPVFYEQLVLHPESILKRISEFLDLPWHDSVLHHDEHINKPGGVSLSSLEASTDQVIKPVNVETLTLWADRVPDDVKQHIAVVAPMLAKLGYDPRAYPPSYGQADRLVINNTRLVKQNQQYWIERGFAAKQLTKTMSSTKPKKSHGNVDRSVTMK